MLLELGEKIIKTFERLNGNIILTDEAINLAISEIIKAVQSADVSERYTVTLRKFIEAAITPEKIVAGANKQALVRNAVIQGLTNLVDPGNTVIPFHPKKNQVNVVMFVGLQGSGKTTTIAKYAHHYKKNGFKCGIVCGDTFRAGAFEQLQMNSASIRVPFYGDKEETNPVAIAQAGVELFKNDGFDLILLDTSGRHRQSNDLLLEMRQMHDCVKPTSVFLVMDSTIGQSAFDQAAAFKENIENIGGVIITKMDGHAKGGGALAAVAATKAPIVFLGTGEGFDALQPFNPSSFVSRLIGGGDIKGMKDKMNEMGLKKKAPKLFASMASGEFCMGDLKSILEMFADAGDLSQMMEMMPGNMGRMMQEMKQKTGGGSDQDTSLRMQRFLTIINSMGAREMKFTAKAFTKERLERLARGSGQSMDTCNALLASFQTFAKMGKHLKDFLPKGMSLSQLGSYNPSPDKMTQQQLRALQGMIPLNVRKNVDVMSLMKQMSVMEKKK